MKTIKISEATHKALKIIQTYFDFETLNETIEACADCYAWEQMPTSAIKELYKKVHGEQQNGKK